MARWAWHPEDPWTPPNDIDQHFRTCVAAAKAILAIEPMNRRLLTGLLDQVLWHATVHPDKYRIRWRSLKAIRETRRPRSRFIRHEHVFERSWLRSELVEHLREPSAVLRFAVACLVTVEVDARLRALDDGFSGWARYREAGIEVVGRVPGLRLPHG